MFLIDTNIWLELLLEQEKANECKDFFDKVGTKYLHISEFSLYSIGVILFKLKRGLVFQELLDDLIEANITIARLEIRDLKQLSLINQRYNLDFDDAYQYALAKKYGLTIVSFDSDFDKTEIGRKAPIDVIK